MRNTLVLVHRFMGLATALFLTVAGLTGALISWEHELDEWLNPRLFKVPVRVGKPLDPIAMVRAVEAQDPRIRVSGVPLQGEPGHAAVLWVDARRDEAGGRRFPVPYNQVFVDPVDGSIVGKRQWGKAALDREHLISFLYKLHYSLHVPELAGSDRWGIRFMGVIALIWFVNTALSCFITLPARRPQPFLVGEGTSRSDPPTWWQRWKPSWRVNWRGSWFRINFDLHRVAGLWLFGFLLILSFTSFSLNLYREVFYPLMSLVSKVTPGPFEKRQPTPLHEPIEPKVGWQRLIESGSLEAKKRGWQEPVGDLFYADNFGIQAVRFFAGDNDHGRGGLGVKTLYFDGQTGELLGEKVPWQGSAADKFVQLQFPLHSGRILGTPGRVLISLMGLVVALLSVTGVVIWYKKLRARKAAARNKRNLVSHD